MDNDKDKNEFDDAGADSDTAEHEPVTTADPLATDPPADPLPGTDPGGGEVSGPPL